MTLPHSLLLEPSTTQPTIPTSPPLQVVQVVCCKLTVLQQVLYQHFLESKATRKLLLAASGQGQGHGTAGVLSAITSLKKLCNHPKLIYDAVYSNAAVDKAPSGAKGKAGAGQDALAAGFKVRVWHL